MIVRSTGRVWRVRWVLAATLALLACSAAPPARSPEERAADAAVAARVKDALRSSSDVYAQHVEVDSRGGTVILSGWVYSDIALRAATRVCQAVPGVRRVDNRIEILEPGGAPR